jgi:glycosyltransferase involved in cell wall biosynthesis
MSIAVALLRIARGAQNNVLESLAMGKVVIASPEAAQDVSATNGIELIVAVDAAEFEQRISLWLNSNDRDGIGGRTRECVIQKYSWDANLSRIGGMLDPNLHATTGKRRETTQPDAQILVFPTRKSA